MNDRLLLLLFLDLSRRMDMLCTLSGLAGVSASSYEVLLGNEICHRGDLYGCIMYVMEQSPYINYRLRKVE